MSRTKKGSKAPGWEPWSNLRERQELAADQRLEEYEKSHLVPDYDRSEEMAEAMHCYLYGPCKKCATS